MGDYLLGHAARIGEGRAVEVARGVDLAAIVDRPELSHGVEVLEAKANRVGEVVATGAARLGCMGREPVAKGLRLRVHLGEGRADVDRRRVDTLAEKPLPNEEAPQRRRGGDSVRVEPQEGELPEEAGARRIRRIDILGEPFAGGSWDAVDRGQLAVEEGAAACEELAVVALLLQQQRFDGGERLLPRDGAEFGARMLEDGRVFVELVELVEPEVLVEEVADAAMYPRVCKEALCLGAEAFVGREQALLRRGKEGVVRRGVPEEVGEPGREFKVVEPRAGCPAARVLAELGAEEEVGRLNDSGDAVLKSRVEVAERGRRDAGELDELGRLFGRHGAPPELLAKLGECGRCAGVVAGCSRCAGYQASANHLIRHRLLRKVEGDLLDGFYAAR